MTILKKGIDVDGLEAILALDNSVRDDIHCFDGYSRRWCDIAIDASAVRQEYSNLSKEDAKWKRRSINNVVAVFESQYNKSRKWLNVMHNYDISITRHQTVIV